MADWQPLMFQPVFREYVWGGRRLETVLGKPLGDSPRYAESWEVVDHGEDQSVVAQGPMAGLELRELVRRHGPELLGPEVEGERFPLLFKFLDANQVLSLQVHPNDRQAARLDPPDLGKTEAWVILHAEPDAVLYAGLQPGVDEPQLRRALTEGRGAELMHRVRPEAGQCMFVPAGVPHALGAGLVVAEIQQASNTTFRLHDWGRLGVDGQPRPLHVEQGLAVIDYERGPVDPQTPQATGDPLRTRLVACDKFILDLIELPLGDGDAAERIVGGDGRFHILSVIGGQLELAWSGGRRTLSRGQTTLLPAALSTQAELRAGSSVLDMHLP